MKRPIPRFAIGALLGGLASLTISVSLIALIVTPVALLIAALASRSSAFLAGALLGFGLTWLVLIGTSYTRCVSMGPNCTGSEGMLPFLVVAGAAFVAGMAVGLLGIVRARATGSARGV